ncbi:MAG: EamA family transporter [Sphingomonadales bacterium]|nr:EamA family transporter [Sphingomonadales bacterium]
MPEPSLPRKTGDVMTGGLAVSVAMLLTLSVLWGSAYYLVKVALVTLPPLTLTFGRIAVAAVVLVTVAVARGAAVKGDWRFWGNAMAAAATGMTLPFTMIALGLQTVDSALAAILIATVPLFTLPLAHMLTHDERATARAGVGVVVGFLGVVMLFIRETGGGNTAGGITLVLAASLSYAISALVIKRGNTGNPDGFSTAMVLCAAALIAPFALLSDRPWTLTPNLPTILATIALGVFPTGIATLLLVRLIRRAGATFASLTNYLIPVVGVTLGIVFLDEKLPATAIFGTSLIAIGIYLSRTKARK